ncbi:MAG: sulfotransferase [Bacteroidetes bacterium]|nr:sulfotransferase [Bacteroidota bacterium]
MKDSYLTAGITIGQLFRLLNRNKVAFNAKTLLRLAFLLQGACWSSLFSLIEKARFADTLNNVKVPDDPVFIIGHWRTGSTYLHQALNLDINFHAPTLFEVAVPDSFLVSYPYYRPLFKRLIGKHRPMDQVEIGMDEPQEDEYAIYRTTSYSPLERLVFQSSENYFLDNETPFFPPADDLEQWKKEIRDFYRKLNYKSGKRIISKNPFNSFRIDTLLQIFPKAKFIHITRHPFNVVPSTVNMWKILGKQNTLTNHPVNPTVEEVARFLGKLLNAVEKAKGDLPAGTIAEIRFEDLEKSPVSVIANLYTQLNLPFSSGFEERIKDFIKKTSYYKKNNFTLKDDEKRLIGTELGLYFAPT